MVGGLPHGAFARVLLPSALGCCSCFAGAGPTVGLRDGAPTLGWEVSAETLTVGQSFALRSDAGLAARAEPGQAAVKERTYLLWEPAAGLALDRGTSGPVPFAGVGASFGARWDRVVGSERRRAGLIGGAFIGTGLMSGHLTRGCHDEPARSFLTISLGVRGSEIYLAPKFGVAAIPSFCLGTPGPAN